MQIFHKKTELSYIEVKKNPQFIDWTTKPKDYKEYPHFYRRYSLLGTELEDLKYIGCKTYEKTYGKDKVVLRTNPSAGGLYPCEVYLQIRGEKGFISGIYHYEPLNDSLTLIYELIDDGIEYYLNLPKQNGIIFLISTTYFRSSWKYEDRSIRYMLLDIGHQIGSLIASLTLKDRDYEILFDFNKKGLNEDFSFFGFEYFNIAIKSTKPLEKEAKRLRTKIPFILPTDYFIKNSYVEDFFNYEENLSKNVIKKIELFNSIGDLKNSIENRRSIRAFRKKPITKEEYKILLDELTIFLNSYNIDLFINVHNIVGVTNGSYKNGILIKEGDFSEKSKYLSLEQNIGGNSAFTIFFGTEDFSQLQFCYIVCAIAMHLLYLKSSSLDIGCSSIGAYYDKEIGEFFEINHAILCLCAIGR